MSVGGTEDEPAARGRAGRCAVDNEGARMDDGLPRHGAGAGISIREGFTAGRRAAGERLGPGLARAARQWRAPGPALGSVFPKVGHLDHWGNRR